MQIGMVGLGRMGSNLVRRLQRHGHDCVVTDLDPDAVATMVEEGAAGAGDLAELASKLDAPRVVWVMVPAGVARKVLTEVCEHLDEGDIVIDGGNSHYRGDITMAENFGDRGIDLVDIGTSGGVFGLERGFCMMVGGTDAAVERLEPILDALAPGVDMAERTPGREGDPTPEERGWLHCGEAGSGHFVKMVHNGIEYGMMAALAEGLAILDAADQGNLERDNDAETAPLADPDAYRYPMDLAAITEVWRRGSVISSWLVDLTAKALHADPELDGFEGRVSDSGEGRWTVDAAVELGIPAHVITASLYQRFASRGRSDLADKSLSAMRKEFGGHHEKPSAVKTAADTPSFPAELDDQGSSDSARGRTDTSS